MLFKHVCCVAGKAVRILSYIFDIWLLKLVYREKHSAVGVRKAVRYFKAVQS